MDLKSHIRPNLWRAIQSAYEAEHYCDAIQDAFIYLSEVLRDRSGLDGDGHELVGAALGGKSPVLRLNMLQTETEINQQQGTLFIMKGMYQAIRNPRVHGPVEDDKETVDSVVYFINYLLGPLERAEEPFTVAGFLGSVFDEDFVSDDQYASLLVAEVPVKKVYDVLINLYRDKRNGNIYNVGRVVRALIARLSDKQLEQYMLVVGDELRIVSDQHILRYNLHILPPELWAKIPDVPRLRIENKIIKTVKEGKVPEQGKAIGPLATWAPQHFRYFSAVDTLVETFYTKLATYDEDEVRYVLQYFLQWLPTFVPLKSEKSNVHSIYSFASQIRKLIALDVADAQRLLIQGIGNLPDDVVEIFVDICADLTNSDSPAVYLADGRPFLTGDPSSIHDEDIPF